MKIETLLEKKGRDVVTVRPTLKLATVVRLMKLGHTGCAVVSEDGKQVQGIVSVRDISYAPSLVPNVCLSSGRRRLVGRSGEMGRVPVGSFLRPR